jgi:hypothetical protein
MVEWAGLVVSVVGALLQRLDQRKLQSKEREGVQNGLLELLRNLRAWVQGARRTNEAVENVARGNEEHSEEAWDLVRQVTMKQSFSMKQTLESFERERNTSALEVLFVYEPRLEEALAGAVDKRRLEIELLQDADQLATDADYRDHTRKDLPGHEKRLALTTERLERLRDSADLLEQAANQLAAFLKTHFEPRDFAVKRQD